MNPKIGGFYPQKWMVYKGKPYFLMDDWGGTIIFGNTHTVEKVWWLMIDLQGRYTKKYTKCGGHHIYDVFFFFVCVCVCVV